MKKKFLIIIFLFTIVPVFANNLDGFKVSPIKLIDNTTVTLAKEICEIEGIRINTTYFFESQNVNEDIYAKIEFKGSGATGSSLESFPIPKDLVVKVNDEIVEYEIFYDGRKLDIEEHGEFYKNISAYIKFKIVSTNKFKIDISYTNNCTALRYEAVINYNFYYDISKNAEYLLIINNTSNQYIIYPDKKYVALKKISETKTLLNIVPSEMDFENPIKIIVDSFGFGERDAFPIYEICKEKILLDKQKVFFLNKKQLWLLRNAFYSFHGYKFTNSELNEFFDRFYEENQWMEIIQNPKFSESEFNEAEKANIELIRKIENIRYPYLFNDEN